jgi:hypothetical protein
VIFADQYRHHSRKLMAMMMLAPIAYAVVEICRVPLAIAVRKPAPLLVRLLIVLGLLGAGCVTIKSMSQLGEIMFRPRLFDVEHAREQLADAQSAVDDVSRQISDADAAIDRQRGTLKATDEQLKISTDKLASLPKQDCAPISGVTSQGTAYKSIRCVADPRIAPLTKTIAVATASPQAADDLLNQADAQRSILDRTASDETLRTAKLNYREAVMNSQLHSFTAMLFGKEPTDVTDAEIHFFPRLFVFIPAIGAPFSATIIALITVTRVKIEPAHVELVEGGEYILGPFAEQIIRDATDQAIQSAQAAVQSAAQAGRPLAVVK